MTAAVLVCLRMVRILYTKSYFIEDSHDVYMYKTVFRRTDAMLECILDKRYEDQRCNLYRGVANLWHECHINVTRQSYLHQVDIVLDKLHFIAQHHLALLIVVEHVSQHLRQLLNGILRTLLIDGGKRIDIVQRVQQEVRVNLRAQVQILALGTRPRLRKVDVVLSGEIFEQEKQVYSVPRCEPLTFYISSVSAFVDGTERYKTVVLSRSVEANTACNIDFRTGRADIDERLGNNAREMAYIRENLRNLLLNETFELDSVTIAASASPEGSVAANNALTLRRSRAASEYFEKYIRYVRDSVRREDGLFLTVGDDLTEGTLRGSGRARKEIPFLARPGGEDWAGLDALVAADTVLTDVQKARYTELSAIADPDERENRMKGETWYRHVLDNHYPRLRTVRFTFALHRKGMVKDTVHTTELDTVYMKGVQAIRDHDYQAALAFLAPYHDYNTAVAYVALDRNLSAMEILEPLPRTPQVNYMLALLYARQGDGQAAVQHYLNACGQDRSYISRGNLDPEISTLIKRYDLHKEPEEDWGDLIL